MKKTVEESSPIGARFDFALRHVCMNRIIENFEHRLKRYYASEKVAQHRP